jgi:hypothetical protein
MQCKADGPTQCEHCQGRPTPQRAGLGGRQSQIIRSPYLAQSIVEIFLQKHAVDQKN